ncbi:hypothetical protein GDO78_000223 [Eleutherodactylus coqui]|uniref:Uncharacterized protein n=1 Tax=Eleutherodactylus coqui TaxID=57060 RepID=A0A8J6FRV3_ELECQ|nr:hypothetical protein GDO78_000223 [Eleutherodactylus coqui]
MERTFDKFDTLAIPALWTRLKPANGRYKNCHKRNKFGTCHTFLFWRIQVTDSLPTLAAFSFSQLMSPEPFCELPLNACYDGQACAQVRLSPR